MKVSTAIEMLSQHNPDNEIIIEWWARNFIEIDDKEIPLEIWEWVAENHQFYETTYSQMHEEIEEKIYQAIKEENQVNK